MHYVSVHRKIRRVRGSARLQPCAGGCGATGEQWAYQHNGDPEQMYDDGRPYADDIFKCYEPMCRSCHRKMDIERMTPKQRAAFDEACRINAATAREAVDHTDPEYLAKMRLAGHKGGTARWAKEKNRER